MTSIDDPLEPGLHNSILLVGQKKLEYLGRTKIDMFYSYKECGALLAKSKASESHNEPAGHMLCMPTLQFYRIVTNLWS